MALGVAWSRLRNSLAAQAGALMLLCLVAAQWVAVWAFCDERAAMLRNVAHEQAVRELRLVAMAGDGDLAALSREDLSFWRTAARPEFLPAEVASRMPRPNAAMAAHADAGFALEWRMGADGVATARFGYQAAILSAPLPSGASINAALVMPRWTDPWAMQTWSALFLTSVALLLAGVVIARRITAPMRLLAQAADRFGGGATVPVLAQGPTEVARTLDAFNAMQERIGGLLSDRSRMLSAVGHDLRTPMTRLRLRAHLIEEGELREPVLRDLDEMEGLADRALDLARGDCEAIEPTDVAALLSDLVDDLEEAGIAAARGPIEAATAPVRAGALRRAVANLLENAHRYGGGGALAVARVNDRLRIAVTDDGPGIPEDRLAAVMQPFVRLEGSRARHTGGSGLGLALVSATARDHGGRLHLANRPEGGLSAVIEIPTAPRG